MYKNNKQTGEELQKLKKSVERLSRVDDADEFDSRGEVSATLIKYMLDERKRTNRILGDITEKLNRLEEKLHAEEREEREPVRYQIPADNREVPLSSIDARILEFAQTSQNGMVCADDIRALMKYRGRNAACARLNRLFRAGLLDRFQLGHKVYFKYDAGKTTKTLIISPPQ